MDPNKKLREEKTKGYAEIIFKEIGTMEVSLQALEEMWKEEEKMNRGKGVGR